MPRRIGLIFVFSLAPALLTAIPAQKVEPASEKWFVITIADKPVGYSHERVVMGAAGSDTILSASDTKMVLNRLGAKVELRMLSSYEETKDGLLIKVGYEMQASLLSTKTEAVIKGQTIEIRSQAGGKSYTRTLNFTGTLLGPEGIRQISQKRLRNPGDVVEFQTFVAELDAVSKGSRKVLARETLKIAGKDVPELKVEEVIEATAGKGTAWLDDEFEAVKQEMPTPFGTAQVILTDREQALAAASGEELPAEMYATSIIRSNIRVPKARSLEYLKVRLVHRKPELGWPEIKSPYQTVLSKSADSLILEIRRPKPSEKAAGLPVAMNENNKQFLLPNAYIQSDMPELQALARTIIGSEKDTLKAALKLERWVTENMKFDLGIVLAPSSEIFKNRRGTCVGYATLLAALTRAVGIPSRIVMGYVYVLGMFGGHAWTEIWIGESWIPIDAAIVAQEVADAGRLYFIASSLYEGAGSLAGGGAGQQVFGQVDIKILEYAGLDGKKVAVPESGRPYGVNGDLYANQWLGLELLKPPDSGFAKLDSVWPETTVAVIEGPKGEKIELQEHYLLPWKAPQDSAREILDRLNIPGKAREQKVSGRPAIILEAKTKAAMVIIDKPEAWVLIAEGNDAPKWLARAAAGLKLL
ncbi:MAG: transglutaminase-like domain-containing protein [Candidatus Aminicenantes bacterium]|nr:transglutaminase-like domain-containing protein [Candidatus Aminicenantes bacterium]